MLNLIIHRGSHEIGGSCVELISENSRLLIDVGLPLNNEDHNAAGPTLPRSLDESLKTGTKPIVGVLISHPHVDHYGLINSINEDIPVYAGRVSAELMKLSSSLSYNEPISSTINTFISEETFQLGDFAITPIIMDHSGVDSYAFRIRAGGKSIFYSGDFRDHGRKRRMMDKLFRHHLYSVDALLMEGSVFGREGNKANLTEEEIEGRFTTSIDSTDGAVFVTLAGQNIDRIVSLYKAAKKCGRTLVIDPYTAEVLDKVHEFHDTIPHPSWQKVAVYYPWRLCRWLEDRGHAFIVDKYKKYGKNWNYLSENASKIVMILRPSSADQMFKDKYFDLSKARWIYSMWRGYLDRDTKLACLASLFEKNGTIIDHIHTSGHADVGTLKALANGIHHDKLIPIHTMSPDTFSDYFDKVHCVDDGQVVEL